MAPDAASAVQRSAHAIGLSVSDFIALACAEKLGTVSEEVSLAHRETEDEIARLSRLAEQATNEIAGKKRGAADA
jgi:hypothetical protein